MLLLYIVGGIIGLLLIIIAGLYLYSYFAHAPLRPKEKGFEYVHVDYDGSVRELYPDEVEYLSQKFDGADGGRPYIKFKYEQRTPDGKCLDLCLEEECQKISLSSKKIVDYDIEAFQIDDAT